MANINRLSRLPAAFVRTRACGYYNLSEAVQAPLWVHLHPEYPPECEDKRLMGCDVGVFDGAVWTRWTSHHWHVPLTAVIAYIVGIPLLQALMARRAPLSPTSVAATMGHG